MSVSMGCGSFRQLIDSGLLTVDPSGSVAGGAWPSQSSRRSSTPLIQFGLLAAAGLIILALLCTAAREPNLSQAIHSEQEC
jgi:hypothetical protein